MNLTKKSGSLVYSTAFGRMCPQCSNPLNACRCSKNKPSVPKSDGIVRISRETKGRRGKGVTVITGVPLNSVELEKLGRQLKQRCGTGGTVKDGTIEIQGDHRDLLLSELEKLGWVVKKAGG
ncbi:MAG: translation initiation factor Sui1 [Methylococcaceae bacterium]|jgi:translation initiation factor 1|nr:translation initiation factor Sui1 [Methylococcaceae bacterium]